MVAGAVIPLSDLALPEYNELYIRETPFEAGGSEQCHLPFVCRIKWLPVYILREVPGRILKTAWRPHEQVHRLRDAASTVPMHDTGFSTPCGGEVYLVQALCVVGLDPVRAGGSSVFEIPAVF